MEEISTTTNILETETTNKSEFENDNITTTTKPIEGTPWEIEQPVAYGILSAATALIVGMCLIIIAIKMKNKNNES